MILDLIETTIFNHATNEFPNRVSSTMIQVASVANQMKWISAGFGMISLLSLFVYNSMLAMKRVKKSHQQ